MESIEYYDTIDMLAEDIKKKTGINVAINDNAREIIIGEAIVHYEKTDLNLRSFSKPFFIDNQIRLDLAGCNSNLKKELIEICEAYTDHELEAIVENMPIVKMFSSERRGHLTGTSVIWRDHFLEDNVGLLCAFIRMGVQPKDILVFDKGDSTKHRVEITATFKKLGFQVELMDNNILEEQDAMARGAEVIDRFITDRMNKKIIILDDGAIVTKILSKLYYSNVVAIVELTEMGLRRIKKMEDFSIRYPVLNLAKTELKKHITYKEISNTIFTRCIALLGDEKISGRVIIQLGYGDLGRVLAKRFRQYGARVCIVDPDIMKLIQAAEEGFAVYNTLEEAMEWDTPFMIIGASGEQSISRKAVFNLKDGAFVTAGATADLSIFKQLEQEGVRHKFIPQYGTQYEIQGKRITVLGNGRSVNLFDSESIPNQSIDIFKAGTLVTAYKSLLQESKLPCGLQLEIVNQWIKDAGILETYYEIYLKKRGNAHGRIANKI